MGKEVLAQILISKATVPGRPAPLQAAFFSTSSTQTTDEFLVASSPRQRGKEHLRTSKTLAMLDKYPEEEEYDTGDGQI
ncbi:hypothetical protein CPLU01_10015 [Colletotrichum plurivorum]|uniref:Uncharacterized protein n=1 Tax=Colletotrichum plurivorum TaxID=2175906 RepID=A0A8H6K7I5_9PEZI|nr:hypothetical protein CPLU01_10015 [Colletotrichum plurivorum]